MDLQETITITAIDSFFNEKKKNEMFLFVGDERGALKMQRLNAFWRAMPDLKPLESSGDEK